MEENRGKGSTITHSKKFLKGTILNITLLGLVGVAVVSVVTQFRDVAFSAYQKSHSFSDFWLFISDTGTTWGSVISIAIAACILAVSTSKVKKGLVFLISFGIVLKIFSYVNENITKEIIRKPRPSFVYLDDNDIIQVDSVYQFRKKPDRIEYLKEQNLAKDTRLSGIDDDILEHWMYSVGYSMPSGHAQNSFLLATVLSAILLLTLPGIARLLYVAPIIWATLVCISRVTIGVHTSLDVTVGAFTGLLIGIAYLMIVRIRLLNNLDLY
jgi:membrane-associated phospholipid phosphatase